MKTDEVRVPTAFLASTSACRRPRSGSPIGISMATTASGPSASAISTSSSIVPATLAPQ
jgi:hypothetical protein